MAFGSVPIQRCVRARRRTVLRCIVFTIVAFMGWGAEGTPLAKVFREAGLQLPRLTAKGQAVRKVLIVAHGSGYCGTGRDDWRGEMPRYLSAFLPRAESILVQGRQRLGKRTLCRSCVPDSEKSGEEKSFRCGGKLGNSPPDLMLVFGTGVVNDPLEPCQEDAGNWTACAQNNYPSLKLLQRAKLLPPRSDPFAVEGLPTTTVHFPVRKVDQLFQNPYDFTHVLGDDSYFKPVALETAARLSQCAAKYPVKARDLLFVARYTEHKGQVEFVRRLDPSLLGDYTIHFYGGEDKSPYARLLRDEVKRRGLRAVVHGRVLHSELLDHVCRSAGQVHYALADNNPRAVYEAFFAGNPALVSAQSKMPPSVLRLPFVRRTDASSGAEDLNADFAAFIDLTKTRWNSTIAAWANKHMHPLSVYRGICEKIGICAPESRAGGMAATRHRLRISAVATQ